VNELQHRDNTPADNFRWEDLDRRSDRDDATILLQLIRQEVRTATDTIVAAVKV
jgi:hypothetical protein